MVMGGQFDAGNGLGLIGFHFLIQCVRNASNTDFEGMMEWEGLLKVRIVDLNH